jgi:hypothetical protein
MFPLKTVDLATFVLAITCSLSGSNAAVAQTASAHNEARPAPLQGQPLSDQDIQMLRHNLRSQRRQVIASNMKLTDTEGEKFWPIYDQYIADLVKLNGTKYDLIKQYVQNNGVLTDTQAESAVKKWISVDQGVSELRLRYVPLFQKALSAQRTALFYLVDRRVQLMIDLQLMMALPLVEPPQ